MDLRQVVESSLSEPQKCYGHCDQQANMRFLSSGEPLVACYACPAGYVSKIIAYGKKEADSALRAYVTKALGGRPLKEEEIRTATRYPWDLGLQGAEMKVAYWTQNYRASKSEDPNRQALFLCSDCGSPFLKLLTESRTKCSNCMS